MEQEVCPVAFTGQGASSLTVRGAKSVVEQMGWKTFCCTDSSSAPCSSAHSCFNNS